MGKRSNFPRIEKDFYKTIDPIAGIVLAKFHEGERKYYEPCAGDGDLISQLESHGFWCGGSTDISVGKDALTLNEEDVKGMDIITNPPWSRDILHKMITHFCNIVDVTSGHNVYLLFDANWMFTKQAQPYLKRYCTAIKTVGRMQWIPDTNMKSKDDVCWYKFNPLKNERDAIIFDVK